MSEYIWPAVVLICAVLAFIRTGKISMRMSTGAELDIGALVHETEALVRRLEALEQAPGSPKAIVDRLNLIAKDLNETIKPRILAVEEVAQEAKRLADRHQSAATAKAIAGVKVD